MQTLQQMLVHQWLQNCLLLLQRCHLGQHVPAVAAAASYLSVEAKRFLQWD